MKVNRLESHDRLLAYQKQHEDMGVAVSECIKNVPDEIHFPFYVYGHSRTVGFDEKLSIVQHGFLNVPETRLIWMPTITKPIPTPNSYLFLAEKHTDVVKIIWMLPKRELWSQYEPGKMFHNENVWTSIQNFLHAKEKLSALDKDGPTEEDVEKWRRIIGHEAHRKRKIREAAKRATEEASSAFLASE